MIFDGYSLALDGAGKPLAILKGFEEDFKLVDLNQETADGPSQKAVPDPIEDLWKALVLGVHDYFHKLNFTSACLGLSGGIDSAVAAAIAVAALGKENVVGVAMPSRYSSPGSLTDAYELAQNLSIKLLEIPIEEPYASYLHLLTPHFTKKTFDTAEENLQARIRGMILMALSNKEGHLVLSTGNKSEMAMGYSTLYGDLAGGLALLADVSKERVYQLAHYANREKVIIPLSTIQKPPSAELREGQKDSDSLPAYPIVDAVLEGYIEQNLTPAEIAKQKKIPLEIVSELVRKIHLSEYKRRQAPPGLRVTEKAFTVGRKFPIVQRFH